MSYNVLGNVLTGWRGTKTNSPDYAHILAGGGVMRYGSFLEGDRAEHVKNLIKAGVKDNTILTTPEKIRAMFAKAWDFWQDLSRVRKSDKYHCQTFSRTVSESALACTTRARSFRGEHQPPSLLSRWILKQK